MTFQNFTFPQVAQELGVSLTDADLYAEVRLIPFDPIFLPTRGASFSSPHGIYLAWSRTV